MIHLYYGDGKGKTSTAVGAAVRAAGAGWQVRFVQFLKNGDSSELAALKRLGVDCPVADCPFPLLKDRSPDDNRRLRAAYTHLIDDTAAAAARTDLIVLDEVVDACALQLVDESAVRRLLEIPRVEWILTGHTLSPTLAPCADYITHMQAERHPYERGCAARRGVEF